MHSLRTFKNFIYLFLSVLGLHCYTGFFSSYGEWQSSCSVRALIVVVLGQMALGHTAFSSCCTWAQ